MAKFGFDWYFKANEFEFCSFSYYTIEQFLRIFIRAGVLRKSHRML